MDCLIAQFLQPKWLAKMHNRLREGAPNGKRQPNSGWVSGSPALFGYEKLCRGNRVLQEDFRGDRTNAYVSSRRKRGPRRARISLLLRDDGGRKSGDPR